MNRLIALLVFTSLFSLSQNETKKWVYGTHAGLDFLTTSPSIFSTSINAPEGCSSISDINGNLLFYSDGVTVWMQNHQVMANGTGLLGDLSATQSAMIVKQPGNSNIYYLFTVDRFGNSNGLRYSIIDMSLAAGMGSVTIKNTLLYTPSTEKITGVSHCNGKDVWILSHQWNNNNFVAHLLTNTGIVSSSVVTSIGAIPTGSTPSANNTMGAMKISPSGKKIALCMWVAGNVELYDFDNSTGVVSNSIVLTTGFSNAYGCEFSPDGSKLYASGAIPGSIFQWDICAGNNSAIVASKTQITNEQNVFGLQCAPNGKMYVAHNGSQYLGVISNPNALGAACNYSSNGLYISNGSTLNPLTSNNCLPNFVSSAFRQASPAFTYSALCQNVSYTNAAAVSTVINNCAAATYSLASYSWNFGDPLSGAANNTSTAQNPKHVYSSTGTYTSTLILNYQCYSDTLKQVVNVSTASPTFAVSGATAICKGEKTIYTASGAQNYTWAVLPTSVVNSSISLNPTVTTQYTVSATSSVTGCRWDYVFSLTVNKCLGLNDVDGAMENVAIYPNPTTGNLFIESEKQISIAIYNQLGQLLLNKQITESKTQIDLSSFSKGLYFIKINDGEKVKVKEIVKVE